MTKKEATVRLELDPRSAYTVYARNGIELTTGGSIEVSERTARLCLKDTDAHGMPTVRKVPNHTPKPDAQDQE